MRIIEKENKKMHIAIILDNSASMACIREATIKAFNKQVETIHAENRDDVDVKTTFVTFGEGVDQPIFFNSPVENLKKITKDHYKADSGSTSLSDAIGITILKLMGIENYKKTDFLVITLTDGQENSSTLFTKEVVKNVKEKMCQKDKWKFVFLVANNPKSYFVENYGAEEENVTVFETTDEGMKFASDSMSETVSFFIRS